jgi:cytidine deaminase
VQGEGAHGGLHGEVEDDLLRAAHAASELAYAPYSGQSVGAALLTPEGAVITGCNVENASFGLTQCAERAALTRAIAAGERRFRALAVAGSGSHPPLPCGACRQVLREFAEELWIVCEGRSGPRARAKLSELLPQPYTAAGPT